MEALVDQWLPSSACFFIPGMQVTKSENNNNTNNNNNNNNSNNNNNNNNQKRVSARARCMWSKSEQETNNGKLISEVNRP